MGAVEAFGNASMTVLAFLKILFNHQDLSLRRPATFGKISQISKCRNAKEKF
jgi:hypothetical protein